jgi:hypothetical protein
MKNLSESAQKYEDVFGESVDCFNLVEAIGHDSLLERLERAISDKKPIDFKKEFGIEAPPPGCVY